MPDTQRQHLGGKSILRHRGSPNGTTLAHRHVRLPACGKGMIALAGVALVDPASVGRPTRRSGYSDSYLNDNWILVR
jgi:hypothetical protein